MVAEAPGPSDVFNTLNFTSTTRLYRLSAQGELASLMVYAWNFRCLFFRHYWAPSK